MAGKLGARIAAVIRDLDIEQTASADGTALSVGSGTFAIVGRDRLEVLLDPIVAAAAARTPDTVASGRGPGWVLFTPARLDRFALDRAEAWLRSAHRQASSS